jgi:DNA-binding IclR family transcriptional regulator
MPKTENRPMLNSVANALRVLEYLIETGEARVSEIGRELNVTVGTAHRLVGTLVGAGFAEQNPTNRRYRPSLKLLVLANQMRSRLGIRDLTHNRLTELTEATHETANLGVLDDDRVLYVDKVFSDQVFGIEAKVGARVPAYCTALGKVLIAYQDEQAREDYLARMKAGGGTDSDHPPPDAAAFRRELAKVVQNGYAEDHGEYLPDVFCVAAPVSNGLGKPTAAVSVSVPRSRFRTQREEFIAAVKRSAEALSQDVLELGITDLRP